ncbi:hypothetical protein E2C01_008887 [Portunus trituberculatus]|uniref:Uncharacterized protein n=1 Tax=Portunus trituberculatus TaxID=210409 RepID=A0A5B7D4W9_PORTR|nr:hypothetical protein [Portunus trituberculatus]
MKGDQERREETRKAMISVYTTTTNITFITITSSSSSSSSSWSSSSSITHSGRRKGKSVIILALLSFLCQVFTPLPKPTALHHSRPARLSHPAHSHSHTHSRHLSSATRIVVSSSRRRKRRRKEECKVAAADRTSRDSISKQGEVVRAGMSRTPYLTLGTRRHRTMKKNQPVSHQYITSTKHSDLAVRCPQASAVSETVISGFPRAGTVVFLLQCFGSMPLVYLCVVAYKSIVADHETGETLKFSNNLFRRQKRRHLSESCGMYNLFGGGAVWLTSVWTGREGSRTRIRHAKVHDKGRLLLTLL